MLIIDSREKQWSHIQQYFDKHNIEYEVRKLETGDYFNTDNPNTVIDRKANLQEVCANLSSGKENRVRFVKECQRAFRENKRFIVLIEEGKYTSVRDVSLNWNSKYSGHTGRWLADAMFNIFCAYKVEWMFCDKKDTAEKILELLRYDNRGN